MEDFPNNKFNRFCKFLGFASSNLIAIVFYPKLAYAHDPDGALRWGITAVIIYAVAKVVLALRKPKLSHTSKLRRIIRLALILLVGGLLAFYVGVIASMVLPFIYEVGFTEFDPNI